jgi:glucosyl-dolichyl phosphate glucuronosyltransferase
MDISVLICTRNNAVRLRKTLSHIAACRIPPDVTWEVVLVGHRCEDGTAEVAGEMARSLPLAYCTETREGLSDARNSAIAASSGGLLIFTDDDVTPDPGWIEAYWQEFKASPTGSFWGGPIESDFEDENPDWNLIKLGPRSVKGLDLGGNTRRLPNESVPFVGANWACSRDAILAAGGFDPSLGLNSGLANPNAGEETDLMRRLIQAGLEAWYLPAARLHHYVPKGKVTLAHLARRHRAAGCYEARELPAGRIVPLLEMPRWVVRRVMTRWAQWALAKIARRDGFAEYLSLQEALGIAEGMRARRSRS